MRLWKFDMLINYHPMGLVLYHILLAIVFH
uniref:Uncharacterized protein n=1 Tax=Oryza punctata TaxID=4537 RepID=A0A0E0MEU8_ORYPU